MRIVRTGLLVALSLALAGCTSTIRELCEQRKECDPENAPTVEKCVEGSESFREKLEADPGCKTLLEKYDIWQECEVTLSCEEAEELSSDSYKCKAERDATRTSDVIKGCSAAILR